MSNLTGFVIVFIAGGCVNPNCEPGSVPSNAFEITTICALYYPSFTGSNQVTRANMYSCVAQFGHAATTDYGHEMFVTFSDDNNCVDALLSFAVSVYDLRSGSSSCGVHSSPSTWSSSLASSFDSVGCLSVLSTSLGDFVNSNGYDIRDATTDSVCLLSDLPKNAYPIASMCALFDGLYTGSSISSEYVEVTIVNILGCIETRFAYEDSDAYAYELHSLLSLESDSGCAFSILGYTRSAFMSGVIGVSYPNCGDPGVAADWQLYVPVELLNEDVSCMPYLNSPISEFLELSGGIDIRAKTVYSSSTCSLPENAFEIATMCVLINEGEFLTEYMQVNSENMLQCIGQFAHASLGEYGYAMFTHFAATPTSDCVMGIINYARRLFAHNSADSDLCPCDVAFASLANSDIPEIHLQKRDCLNFLRGPIEAVFEWNEDLDIRDSGYTVCDSSVRFPLSAIRTCLIDSTDFGTCVGDEVADCSDCYQTLWDSLSAANFGTLVCLSPNENDDYCLGEVFSNLEEFRKCSAGFELWPIDHVSCNAGTDVQLESWFAPLGWIANEFPIKWPFSSFGLSDCRVCYDEFVTNIGQIMQANEYTNLCGNEGFTAETPDACISFLNEPGNPQSQFFACANFELETLPPLACDSMEGGVVSPVLFIECIESALTTLEGDYLSLESFLASDCPLVSTLCEVCFNQFSVSVYDVLVTNRGISLCANPYSVECASALEFPIVSFEECSGATIVFETAHECASDVSVEKQRQSINLAVEFGLGTDGYEGWIESVYNPLINVADSECFVCFERFINILSSLTDSQKDTCKSGKPLCGLFVHDANLYLTMCLGWVSEEIVWESASIAEPPIRACAKDWEYLNPIYTSHSGLLRWVITLEKAEPPPMYSLDGINECDLCFDQYFQDLVEVSESLFACREDMWSDLCVESLSDAFARFNKCAKGPVLSIESGFLCEYSDLVEIFTPDGLGKANFLNILRVNTTADGLYSFNQTLQNVAVTDDFVCRPCFTDFSSSVISSLTVDEKNTCLTDPTSMDCGLAAGVPFSAFHSCAGWPYALSEIDIPPAVSSTTAHPREILTTSSKSASSTVFWISLIAPFLHILSIINCM